MSDLIVSINVDESRKHNKILIETYEGSIPKLKSKKFSGQLSILPNWSILSCANSALPEVYFTKRSKVL